MWQWIVDIFRRILGLIDGIVYWFIDLLISLFDNLASIRIFGDGVISGIADRLYFLISIIMIFKVSFSIIQYIINPDTFSDKERGMGKTIQGIIITLVALVAVNHIFNFAYNLQDSIIHSHIIEKVILGMDSNLEKAEQQKDRKSSIPINLLNSFITPNTSQIQDFKWDDANGTYKCGENLMYKDNNNDGFAEYNPEFGLCFPSDEIYNYTIIANDGTQYPVQGNTGYAYNVAQQTKDYSRLLGLINDKQSGHSDVYLFEYKFFLSTAIGIFVAILYINFCFDLAIRTVKFGFLQLIAPIPIISMVDPKSTKSGMMSKYVKMCTNTYLGLFIRIAAVNFVVFVVNIIFTSSTWGTIIGQDVGVFIQIIILIGALMFAKELPKLITDLTGIDLTGKFNINPFKRISNDMIGANAIAKTAKTLGAGALGAVGGLAANAYAFRNKQWSDEKWKNPFMAVGSLLGGGFSGAFRGMRSNEKNMFKAAGAGIHGSVAARNLRAQRALNNDGGIEGWARRRLVDIDNFAGIESGATAFDKELAVYDEFLKEQQSLNDYLNKMLEKGKIETEVADFTYNDVITGRQEHGSGNVNVLKNEYERLKASGASAKEITNAKYKYDAALKRARINYITSEMAKNVDARDAAVNKTMSNLNYIREQNSRLDLFSNANANLRIDNIATGEDWDKAEGRVRSAQNRVVATDEYRQAQINRRNDSNNSSH